MPSTPPANKSPAWADAVTQAATLPKQIPGFSYILLEEQNQACVKLIYNNAFLPSHFAP